MNEEDELDINPLFNALQTTYSSLYEKAQENCCLICVPQSECLQGVVVTEKIIKVHILKASPFFKGQYITLHSDKHVVSMTDDGTHVYTQEGFPTKVKIKILGEELGYNKSYKPYKILIIERPLDQNLLKRQNKDEENSGEVTAKYSLKDCKEFLYSFPELTKHIKELEEQLRQFNQNYVLLQDYLDEAVTRLNSITTTTSEKCLKSCHKKLVSNKFKDVMNATVETYVMASVHSKLFTVICSKFSREDKQMLDMCISLNGLTADQLHVPQQFSCPLPAAVVELANLDRLQSPVEKLYCLKTTFDNLTQEINTHIELLQPPGITTEEMPCLTSDDLIPILVTVIVQAKCAHLHSDMYYMENWNWSASAKDRDNLSYCLVTFKAALQYMTSSEFDIGELHRNLAQNEMSLEDIIAIRDLQTEKPSTSKTQTSVYKPSRPRTTSQSRLDQQLQNITKMLDETSTEENFDRMKRKSPIVSSVFHGSQPSVSPPPIVLDQSTKVSEDKKKDKGEFLSQLENDLFLFS